MLLKISKKICHFGLFLPLSLLFAGTAFGQANFPFTLQTETGKATTAYLPEGTTFDPRIPTPESVLGNQVGAWHVRHDQLVSYMRALAAASDRVTLTETGRTHENRPLLLLTITAADNQGKVETWRQAHLQAIQTGESVSVDAPLFLYMGYSVHGNEPSGANASLVIAYYLAAAQNQQVQDLLSNNVVLLDPSLNPDGLSRFAQWANMHKGYNLSDDPSHREHDEGWPSGRTNHYWFDLNRDWLMLTHPESQARITQFQAWRPHILTDFHEMGSNGTYFFQPGVRSRKYPLTPEGNVTLTEALAEYHAQAFDSANTLYYTQEGFDDFFYGKGSSYPDAQGSIGILFEQASSRGHLQATDNGPLNFTQTIQNQVRMTLSTFAGALANKPAILKYQKAFYDETQEAIEKDDEGGYVIEAPTDGVRLQAMLDIFDAHHITYQSTKKAISLDGTEFSALTSVFVPLDQLQYRLVKSLFSKQQRFADNTFYDVSTWNLPYALNLTYAPVSKRQARQVSPTAYHKPNKALLAIDTQAYAYAIEWHNYNAPALLQQLLRNGVKAKLTNSAFTAKLDGEVHEFAAGTVLIPRALSQPENFTQLLSQMSKQSQVPVYSIQSGFTPVGNDVGSRSWKNAVLPHVMIIGGNGVSQYEVGEVWHYLDTRVGLPVSIVEAEKLKYAELAKYTHIVMVNGYYSRLDDSERLAIKNWVKAGGTLIGQKSAVRLFAQEGWLHANVSSGNDIDKAFSTQGMHFADRDALRAKKLVAGAVYQADVDLTHPLFFGYDKAQLPLFKTSNMVVTTDDDPFKTIAHYTQSPLLAGYSADEMQNMISESTAVLVESMGDGKVIGLVDNVHFRGFWLGTNKLMSNALFMSPLM